MVNPASDAPTPPTRGSRDPGLGDPVLARRRRIAYWVGLAKRLGYGLLLLAMISFVTAAVTGFTGWLVTVTVIALIGACVVLPIPIILGYGVRAAERDERDARDAAAAQARKAAGGVPPATRQ